MKQAELREKILACLTEIAPEVDAATIQPNSDLREQIDIDSMDFLNFIIAVHEATGVDIPEVDYPKLTTIDKMDGYIRDRLGGNESD